MTTRNSTNKTAFLVLGSFVALLGAGLGIGGGALVWAHSTQRDSGGFYSTSAEPLKTASYGIVSDQVELDADAADFAWVPGFDSALVRLQATASNNQPVFVGIAPTAEVEKYLAGAAHAVVTDFEVDPFRVDIRETGGTARPPRPAGQSFWSASATGTGTQTVTWPAQAGSWTAVVMNADGSPGVAVDVAVGAKTGVLLPIGLGLLGVALGMAAGGIALIVAGSTGNPSLRGPSTVATVAAPKQSDVAVPASS